MTSHVEAIAVLEADVRARAEMMDPEASKTQKEARLLLGTAAMHLSAAGWLLSTEK